MQRTKRPRIWRRQFIVDRRFQYEMMIRAGVYAVGGMAILCVGIFYPLIRDLLSGKENVDASTAMLYLHEHFWPVAVLCLVLALLTSVHITHRIAGPLYRIKRQLERLGKGEIPAETTTRKRDYLKEEVRVFNDAMASLTRATDAIKLRDLELMQELDAVASLLEDNDLVGMKEAFDRLEKKAQGLHQAMLFFGSSGQVTPDGRNSESTRDRMDTVSV